MMSEADNWIPGNPVTEFDNQTMIRINRTNAFAEEIPDRLREAQSMFGGDKVERLSES